MSKRELLELRDEGVEKLVSLRGLVVREAPSVFALKEEEIRLETGPETEVVEKEEGLLMRLKRTSSWKHFSQAIPSRPMVKVKMSSVELRVKEKVWSFSIFQEGETR